MWNNILISAHSRALLEVPLGCESGKPVSCKNVRALPALYALDTQSLLGMSGIRGIV